MFKQGPIPAFVHGIVEYLAAILFIAAPFLFTFDEDSAVAVSIAVGVVLLIVAACTHWQTGMIDTISVHAHVMIDYLLAIFLIASPFIFGFDDDGTAVAFFIVLGVLYLLLTIATRFVKEERPPARATREKKRA